MMGLDLQLLLGLILYLAVSPNMELMFEWLDNDLRGVEGPGTDVDFGARFRFSRFAPGLAIDAGMIDFRTPTFHAVDFDRRCGRRHHDDGWGAELRRREGEGLAVIARRVRDDTTLERVG